MAFNSYESVVSSTIKFEVILPKNNSQNRAVYNHLTINHRHILSIFYTFSVKYISDSSCTQKEIKFNYKNKKPYGRRTCKV